MTIGIIHPGEMGAAVGAALVSSGHRVVWASESRGLETRQRAERAGLEDLVRLGDLLEVSDVVLSIVPPHAAMDVAASVGSSSTTFVDANAISPAESDRCRAFVEDGGGRYVDGAIIGPPPTRSGITRLYVSGAAAADVSSLLDGELLRVVALDGDSTASALKMTYAAWTKGTTALLLASLALARQLGVEDELQREWALSQPHLPSAALDAGASAARKGWRWVDEMRQISSTFEDVGLPGGFHEAAASLYDSVPQDPTAERSGATLESVINSIVGIDNAGRRDPR